MTVPDYEEIFGTRGHKYNAAMRLCPTARDQEGAALLDLLGDPDTLYCDIPAGGGFLADQLNQRWPDTSIVCIEPAPEFAADISEAYSVVNCPMDAITLEDQSVDSVGSLAGIHHLTAKPPFFKEVHRILKPGCRFAIADVMKDTAVAAWLNGDVDELSPLGHDGMFLGPGELTALLTDAGFSDVVETYIPLHWVFPDWDTMLAFNRLLFGLEVELCDLDKRLSARFAPRRQGGQILQPWSLVYAKGVA